jgi:uracil DNA glycosylase
VNLSKNIENSWQKVLKEEFEKPYFLEIEKFLNQEIKD